MNLAIDEYGNVNGSFSNITSLEEFPKKIDGYFCCCNTIITSLKGAPKYVGGFFDCSNTNIVSLEDAPEYVKSIFNCSFTEITSLDGAPKKCETLFCDGTRITKQQIIEYLRHNDCKTVHSNFGTFHKKDIIKKLAVE